MCKTHFLTVGRKCVAMGNGILWQKWGEKSCVTNYFLSFSPILMKFGTDVLPWGVDVQDTFFDSGRKLCCHGNGILWQKLGKNLASRTTSSVFHQFSWNLAQMFALGCRCARHIFWTVGRKCVAIGNGILWQKIGGKIYASRNYFLSFSPILMKFGTRCLPWGVDVQDTFFESGRKCVAMVTAYYWQKLGKNLASRTTSSVFHQFSWNLAQMFAFGCRCARHIFWQW